ncbi:MAG: ATP phosphoribosyltransferase regulatory subunit [Bacillota bacterium]
MQPFLINSSYSNVIDDFQQQEVLINKLKHRFKTYGYRQIKIPAFEYYDMYASINGIVNTDDMVKVMDPKGKVLVLRPDVTIPITQVMVNHPTTQNDRYFYIMDIFRYHDQANQVNERTQAGIEHFGKKSATTDAEVIALAIHTLQDMGFIDFKMEIGHAGLFKALISLAGLSKQELIHLQNFIQSKNIAELEPYLNSLEIDDPLKELIRNIPFLYGLPDDVINAIQKYGLQENMQAELQHLIDVYDILKAYQLTDYIIFNLGLINDMDYYSDIIFQGFIEFIGEPVVMGGRYDQLGKQFGASIPAIGFAYDLQLLERALQRHELLATPTTISDIIVYYHPSMQKKALTDTLHLRKCGYVVLSFPDQENSLTTSACTIHYQKDSCTLINKGNSYQFHDITEVQELLVMQEGEV